MIPSPRYIVRGITVVPDLSVSIEYTDAEQDLRTNGLVQNHVLYIPRDSDYENELEEFHVALQALLQDAIQDLGLVEPVNQRLAPSPDDDDEDQEKT